jgi:hypothetical protein
MTAACHVKFCVCPTRGGGIWTIRIKQNRSWGRVGTCGRADEQLTFHHNATNCQGDWAFRVEKQRSANRYFQKGKLYVALKHYPRPWLIEHTILQHGSSKD